jgi:hypothetical protein
MSRDRPNDRSEAASDGVWEFMKADVFFFALFEFLCGSNFFAKRTGPDPPQCIEAIITGNLPHFKESRFHFPA